MTMRLTIAKRINIVSALLFIGMMGMAGTSHTMLKGLATAQDAGATSFRSAIELTAAASISANLYRVIADSEINHKLDETEHDWPAARDAALKTMANIVAEHQSPDEAPSSPPPTAHLKSISTFMRRRCSPPCGPAPT